MIKPCFKSAVCVFLLACIVSPIHGGSFYSSKGIGLVRYFTSGRAAGMGGVGLSFGDNLTVNYLNPATLVDLSLTTINGNFLHESADLKSLSQDANITDSNIFGVQFAIPLKQNRITMALGVNPYSTVDFSFLNSEPTRTETVSGDGGVNTAFFSLAVRPFDKLSLGVTGLFYFGVLRNIYRVDFVDPEFFDTRDEVAQSFTAGNVRFGIVFEILPDWNIGGVFSPSVTLDANKTVTLRGVAKFSDFADRDLEIPLAFGGGTSIEFAKKLLFGVDFYLQKWSEFGIDGLVNNSVRIGAGIEYSARGDQRDSFFSRTAYRAGIFYRDLGIEEPMGEEVTELFGSVGLG
ncbi:hypothetical protein GWN60_10935, partial [candidate division KSB1 bacterium]|nr:hypothetical protein [candidate division KSB1 bacterium]